MVGLKTDVLECDWPFGFRGDCFAVADKPLAVSVSGEHDERPTGWLRFELTLLAPDQEWFSLAKKLVHAEELFVSDSVEAVASPVAVAAVGR